MKGKILVIGSTNVDFLIKSDKLPGLGETVTDGIFIQNFGGKGANQAVGAARAGGNVAFITCLGEDRYEEELIQNFIADGIDVRNIFRQQGVATGSALIMIDHNGNNYLSVAPGSNYYLTPAHVDEAIDHFIEAELIVLQMEIPVNTTSYIFELSKKYQKRIIFNLAPVRPIELSVLENLYALVVNEVEASSVSGLKVETDDEVNMAAEALLKMGPEIVIITLGARGSYLKSKKFSGFIPPVKVKAIDTTAAGDVFCGTLAVALSEGKSVVDAVRFANAASAICVTKMGAQPSAPFRVEIDHLINQQEQ